jgi:hypothetical protein
MDLARRRLGKVPITFTHAQAMDQTLKFALFSSAVKKGAIEVCRGYRPYLGSTSYVISMSTFVKGYKIDRDKLNQHFGSRPDDPDNKRFLSIWEKFPHPFLYVGGGEDPEGHIDIVVVLADGTNKEELEKTPIPALSEPYTSIFTPGIWVSY